MTCEQLEVGSVDKALDSLILLVGLLGMLTPRRNDQLAHVMGLDGGLPRRPSRQSSVFFLVVNPVPMCQPTPEGFCLAQAKALPEYLKPQRSMSWSSKGRCGPGTHRNSQASGAATSCTGSDAISSNVMTS